MERFQHFLNFIKPSNNFYEKYSSNSRWCFQVYWISRENMVSVNLQFKVKFFTEIIYCFGLVCKTSATFIVYYFEPKRSWFEIADLSTAWKVSKYGVISGPYFPAFGLNTEIYGVNLRIQSEYRKIRTKNNSVFGHFSHSGNNKFSWFNVWSTFSLWKRCGWNAR